MRHRIRQIAAGCPDTNLFCTYKDDQFAIRRQIRDAERDIEYSNHRIGEIGQDLDRLVPAAGEAFRMKVLDEAFTERKLAGRALMKEILTLVQLQQRDIAIASIGGFDLQYSSERFDKDGYRYATMLIRTGTEAEIELPVTTTPLGAISRLEHAITGFEEERVRYRQRLADAERGLGSYCSPQGGEFAFSDELVEKRRQLAEIEAALAKDVVGGDMTERQAGIALRLTVSCPLVTLQEPLLLGVARQNARAAVRARLCPITWPGHQGS